MPKSRHHFALSAAYIQWIHDTLLAIEWPGVQASTSAARAEQGLLESAAARPFQTAFARYIHRGVTRRAASLFHSLIANHPFGDGNKRTAVTALHHFLLANGLLLLADRKFMYDLALNTASSGERGICQDELLREITKVLKSRTVPVSQLRRKPEFVGLYKSVSTLRRHIRANVRNRVASEEQAQPQPSLPFSS